PPGLGDERSGVDHGELPLEIGERHRVHELRRIEHLVSHGPCLPEAGRRPKTPILNIGGGDGMKEEVKTEVELRQLRVFVTVVEAGGQTRAARILGLSQSTVSETLVSLERTLGTELFRKGARGVALTRSGEALLPYARRVLALT